MKEKIKKVNKINLLAMIVMIMLIQIILPILSVTIEMDFTTISNANDISEIKFEDKNLYDEISKILSDKIESKNDNTFSIKITQTDIKSIEELEIKKNNISSIKGIESFTNLKSLLINQNNISDITCISKLLKLKRLFIGKNKLFSIEAIGNLSSLTGLALVENEIENLEPLRNLYNLEELELGGNKLTNIEPLSGLTNLERLGLGNGWSFAILNQQISSSGKYDGDGNADEAITDISPLKNLTKLKELDLDYNHLTNINDLYNLTELTDLSLNNNDLTNISAISNMTNLRYLYLENNNISDISCLANCTNLSLLYLGGSNYYNNNYVENIDVLKNLTNLKKLNLRYNSIIDTSVLENMKNIELEVENQVITKAVKEGESFDLIPILKDVRDKNSIAYTDKELIYSDCSLSEDGNSIIIDNSVRKASVEIQGGLLDGTIVKLNVLTEDCGDISKNNDGSIKAKLDINGVLTISGTGEMKDWKYSGGTDEKDWHNQKENVKEIVMSEGITNIGKYAFRGCENLTNITIPNSVINIGDQAFTGVDSLVSINIPDSVTELGDDCFYSSDELKTIRLSNNIKEIKNETFFGCSKLNKINLPENLIAIENQAFYGCGRLSNIKFPNTVTYIGENAFSHCDNLENIIIPSSVTDIGNKAFAPCMSLKYIEVEKDNLDYEDVDGILYTKDKVKLIQCPAKIELEKYKIPEGTKYINDGAFSNCINLQDIEIPNTVTIIGNEAFCECKITSINIPNSVISIGESIFYNCRSLTNITIPEGVTSIGSSSFEYCDSLTSITIPKGVTSIGSRAFEHCRVLANITIPEGVTSIGSGAFEHCDSLTSIIIPKSVTSIGSYAFEYCSVLTNIIIRKEVTSIGDDILKYSNKAVIYCNSNSMAETYAKNNSINYKIDDDGPIITYAPNGNTVSKSQITRVTVSDDIIGINENSLKYQWTQSTETPTEDSFIKTFINKEEITKKDGNGIWYLWIYAIDNLENISIVRSKAFILDNTSPTLNIAYNTTEITNQNVIATITSNEEIQEANGWTLSNDKMQLTKTYTQNTQETVKIKDIANNETNVLININNIRKEQEIDTSVYDVSEDGYISKIKPNTTIGKLSENLKVNLDADYTEIAKTGMTIKINNKTYTLIVAGDITKDGMFDIQDLSNLILHISNKKKLTGIVLKAADVNFDKEVDLLDLSRMCLTITNQK